MLNPTYAVIASLIWAFSPIYYRTFMKRFDFLSLNFARTVLASVVLAVPALIYGGGGDAKAVSFALLSGLVTLGLGDSLFLLSIGEMGASVATPVVYTYVLLVQLTAGAVGETVPLANVAAALMIVVGVYLLSRGGNGRPRAKGMTMAVAAAVVWTLGQDLIRLATGAGGSALAVAFLRNMAAAVALGAAMIATKGYRKWPRGISGKDYGIIAAIAVSDLSLGSLLYVYSISIIGIAGTVIFTSISPLLTQIFSRALGKERPSRTDFLGGAFIVVALLTAVLVQ